MREFHFNPPKLEGAEAHAEYITQAVEAMKTVHWWRDQHARPLAAASTNLRYHVAKVTGGQPQVTQRLKRVPTMYNKLHRYQHMELARMWDIGGVRARLPGVDEVYDVVDRLKRWKTRGKAHDYIANPKPDGYRAYHLYVEKKGRVVEIQLRTELQDTWANQVERDGRMGDEGYKFGRGQELVRNHYRIIAEVFAVRDAGIEVPPELREQFASSYSAVQSISDPREN